MASAGSLNNSGTVSLALAAGHYFAYAASSNGGSTMISNITYFVVTDGLEALHVRCLTAVQARIRSLALAGLSGGNIVIQKLPLDRPLVGSGGIGLPASRTLLMVQSQQEEGLPPRWSQENLSPMLFFKLTPQFGLVALPLLTGITLDLGH